MAQQNHHPLGACQKDRTSGPTPDLHFKEITRSFKSCSKVEKYPWAKLGGSGREWLIREEVSI
jgi:hypothetical protein